MEIKWLNSSLCYLNIFNRTHNILGLHEISLYHYSPPPNIMTPSPLNIIVKICGSFYNSPSLDESEQDCANLCCIVRIWTRLCESAIIQICERLCKFVQIWVNLRKFMQICTILWKSVQVCVNLSKFVWICTSLWKIGLVCYTMIWFGLISYSVVYKYCPVSGVRNKLNSITDFWRYFRFKTKLDCSTAGKVPLLATDIKTFWVIILLCGQLLITLLQTEMYSGTFFL